jgi:hypothetical protein
LKEHSAQEIIRDSESALIATRVVNDMNEVLREYGAAAAWRLGDWERIDVVANDSVVCSLALIYVHIASS